MIRVENQTHMKTGYVHISKTHLFHFYSLNSYFKVENFNFTKSFKRTKSSFNRRNHQRVKTISMGMVNLVYGYICNIFSHNN